MLSGPKLAVLVLMALSCQVEKEHDPQLVPADAGRASLGGMQFWTDHFVCHEWRIQRNTKFGQFRLLNPSNRVIQSGTYEACRRAFDSVRRQPDFPPIPVATVVSVHGLGRTRNSMSEIGEYVSNNGGFGWVNFGYASTRCEIAENARALRNTLDELALLKREQDEDRELTDPSQCGIRFHFVAHSLGNIIIRQLLSDIERDDARQLGAAWQVGRIVMLGPPNQGSAMANHLQRNSAFRLIAGASGEELGAGWEQLKDGLATPGSEFAIIAGGKSDSQGYSPLLPGDDDLIVCVEETKLSGAADFAVIPSVHTFLMNHHASKAMALSFLQRGFLTSEEKRKRIP